jgi:hypothetical protein
MNSLLTLAIRCLPHWDSVLVFDVGDPACLWYKPVLDFDVVLNFFVDWHDSTIVLGVQEQ